ncbi:MAG TPA: hypothetical protein VFV74_08385 [Burkholderiales bacterium]|nr:hypothetical protein [Burkholderiales bacterium]
MARVGRSYPRIPASPPAQQAKKRAPVHRLALATAVVVAASAVGTAAWLLIS